MTVQTVGWIVVVVGVLIALLGRRIFWAGVGLAGFAIGFLLTRAVVGGVSPTSRDSAIAVAVGVIFGIVFAVLAVRGLPLIATAMGAAFAGVAAASFTEVLSDLTWLVWLAFLVAAVLGGLLVHYGVAPALAILTALAGAGLVLLGLETAGPNWQNWVYWLGAGITLVLGLVVQFGDKDSVDPPDSTPAVSS